jgi:glycerophosphoryl diester phosphodiesterase
MEPNKRTLICAHRGLSPEYPENTILAFRKAIEIGVDLLELDIQMSKDKQIIVCHDSDLFRCSNEHGLVHNLDYEEIQKYDVGMGEKVPLLSEVLNLIKGTKVGLMIEFKAFEIEQMTLNLVKAHHLEEQVMYGSMFYPIMQELRNLDSSVILYPSVGRLSKYKIEDIIKLVEMVNGQYLNIDYTSITQELIQALREKNIGIHAGTPDEFDNMVRMVEMGADILVTNKPKQIIEHLKKL